MMLVVCTSASEIVCTSERLARRAEGKAVGFECVTTVLDEVSEALSVLTMNECSVQQMRTFAGRAAHSASQNGIVFPSTAVKQITAVCAKDERPYSRHWGGLAVQLSCIPADLGRKK